MSSSIQKCEGCRSEPAEVVWGCVTRRSLGPTAKQWQSDNPGETLLERFPDDVYEHISVKHCGCCAAISWNKLTDHAKSSYTIRDIELGGF